MLKTSADARFIGITKLLSKGVLRLIGSKQNEIKCHIRLIRKGKYFLRHGNNDVRAWKKTDVLFISL